MLPVIWTDDDAESDCKSYFNLYTFVVFLAWIGESPVMSHLSCVISSVSGIAVISGFRVDLISPWPSTGMFVGENVTHSDRFLGRVSMSISTPHYQ